MTAVVALVLMAAQSSGSTDLDSVHDPQLIARQPMRCSIGRAVLTEDCRNLQAVGGSHPSSLGNGFGGTIEGTEDLGQVQPTDMEIDGGRCGRSMAQKQLVMMEARSRFNQVGREAVP